MTHKGAFMGIAATSRKATITGISIQRIVEGKIVEAWDNWDQLGLLVQIGAVPVAKFAPAARPPAKAS
jgi:predicted ester cyclase